MKKIKEIKAKSIITKSGLPGVGFVINPYVGCIHGCKYCYARFMKKFTNHIEPWGSFVDVKINAPELITKDKNKTKNKLILMSSVTDPYQPIESKYLLTRRILKQLILLQPHLNIITKSNLVLRDIDLFKKFKHCTIAISLSFIEEKIRKQLEPLASPTNKRIETLKKLHKKGIKTAVFISPIFPEFTDWQKIIEKTKDFTNEYWFENLNPYPSIKYNVYSFLKRNKPELIHKYRQIYSKSSNYWHYEKVRINNFCKKEKITCKIYLHY